MYYLITALQRNTAFFGCCLMIVFDFLKTVDAEFCSGYNHSCDRGQYCCAKTCCVHRYDSKSHAFRFSMWNMWYFWFIVIFILMSCFGSCGYWRRRQLMLAQGATWSGSTWGMTGTPFDAYLPRRRFRRTTVPVPDHYPVCETPYPTTIYPDPNNGVQAQGNFPCPPPYSEVVSKPAVYPVYQHNKDELPSYPGPQTEAGQPGEPQYSSQAPPYTGYQAEAGCMPPMYVPGLPPYTQPAANQPSTQSVSPNQLPVNILASQYQANRLANQIPPHNLSPNHNISDINQSEAHIDMPSNQQSAESSVGVGSVTVALPPANQNPPSTVV